MKYQPRIFYETLPVNDALNLIKNRQRDLLIDKSNVYKSPYPLPSIKFPSVNPCPKLNGISPAKVVWSNSGCRQKTETIPKKFRKNQ